MLLGIGSELLAQKSAVLQDRMIASSMSNEAAGSPFERAWHKTQTSGYRFARPGYAHMMRRVMVKHLLNLAECGERDEIKLSDSAFHFFATNYNA